MGMGKKEKLLERLKSSPKDFTFEEMQSTLEALGFEMSNRGKTSGARVRFKKDTVSVYLHKPHPRKGLLAYQIKQVLEILERESLI
jgi:hypothetical protein